MYFRTKLIANEVYTILKTNKIEATMDVIHRDVFIDYVEHPYVQIMGGNTRMHMIA